MTRDEQRQAWRTYAAAAISRSDGAGFAADWADALLEEERKRFDQPDHSGDANKMVEPRPWVSLTAIERIDLRGWFNRHDSATIDDLLIYHDEMLRGKNGGTR
jgi:hypothetical protein